MYTRSERRVRRGLQMLLFILYLKESFSRGLKRCRNEVWNSNNLYAEEAVLVASNINYVTQLSENQ